MVGWTCSCEQLGLIKVQHLLACSLNTAQVIFPHRNHHQQNKSFDTHQMYSLLALCHSLLGQSFMLTRVDCSLVLYVLLWLGGRTGGGHRERDCCQECGHESVPVLLCQSGTGAEESRQRGGHSSSLLPSITTERACLSDGTRAGMQGD